jgi:hypothetical protein
MDRYWVMDCSDGPFGSGGQTVAIVDEQEGGIILYCSLANAGRILNALTDFGS